MKDYEEFGVPTNASAEEIRQSYRRLARVLHPDAQTEDALRVAAELQMRRLNEILTTLIDPAEWLAYDKALTKHTNGIISVDSAPREMAIFIAKRLANSPRETGSGF